MALTAYQKHVKDFAKTYTGKNLMKAAARKWNKTTGSPKKKTPKSSPKKKGGKTLANKSKGKSKGGNKILGSYGIKGLLLGSGVLAASKVVLPQAGQYGAGGALVAAGAAAKFLDFPGKALLPVGVMVFASEYILGALGRGGGVSGGATGGYDY